MQRKHCLLGSVVGVCLLAGGGGFSIAAEPAPVRADRRAIPPTAAPTGEPAARVVTTQPATTQPAATRPGGRRPYTAPGARFQAMSYLSAGAAYSAVPGPAADLREAGESGVSAAQTIVGRPGLTAPPSQLAAMVVSRPGLQRGPATGLDFGSRTNNVLRPRANPLTGPNGRINDLSRAGFRFGSPLAARAVFRR